MATADPLVAVNVSPPRRDIVQEMVFEDDVTNWLLVFHRGPCPECIYDSLGVIALAEWIAGRQALGSDFFILRADVWALYAGKAF